MKRRDGLGNGGLSGTAETMRPSGRHPEVREALNARPAVDPSEMPS